MRVLATLAATACFLAIGFLTATPATATSYDDSVDAPPWVFVYYKPSPIVLEIAAFDDDYDTATVTDVEILDFNVDGQNDIAVAWYATRYDDLSESRRALSVFVGNGDAFELAETIELYVFDAEEPAFSTFLYGTGDIGVGDFDGDGDQDLAVTAFFGDEMWLIENLGAGAYAKFAKYPYGFNSPTNHITPPELVGTDLDGDGRDELIYLCDPILYIDGEALHFWDTVSTVANMFRTITWEAPADRPYTQWTRAMAVGDFDGDGAVDLAYSGSINPPLEHESAFIILYGFDPGAGAFWWHAEYPSVLCSDIVAVPTGPGCPDGLAVTALDGNVMQWWAHDCEGDVDLTKVFQVSGYPTYSPNRGMTAVTADVDGDGDLDLVTKHKLGDGWNQNQINVALHFPAEQRWRLVKPTPINTTGFTNHQYNEILRPRNLAAGDLVGNTLPEVVAGFAARESLPDYRDDRAFTLEIAIWLNSCLGDASRDGKTTQADANVVAAAQGLCADDEGFPPDADLDKSGCIDDADLALVATDIGCTCWRVQTVGDCNCDGIINLKDINAFYVALAGETTYYAAFPACNWYNADANADGWVNVQDVNPFIQLIEDSQWWEG